MGGINGSNDPLGPPGHDPIDLVNKRTTHHTRVPRASGTASTVDRTCYLPTGESTTGAWD